MLWTRLPPVTTITIVQRLFTIGVQNYALEFSASAAKLSAKLRSLSFRTILHQDDIEYFHKDEHSTG